KKIIEKEPPIDTEKVVPLETTNYIINLITDLDHKDKTDLKEKILITMNDLKVKTSYKTNPETITGL
ncbi:17740_t:CDS:2, partial [Gigaspora margarita]